MSSYFSPEPVAKIVEPSLVELRHLTYLDLSCSHFQGSKIPKFIGSFKHLRHLNLSYSNFRGDIPSEFSNLTNLKTLDLSRNFIEGPLSNVFSNMTSLTYLDLSDNGLNSSIPLSIRNIRKLEHLYLIRNSFTRIEGGELMAILGNLCKLKTLQLSDNFVHGSIGANNNFSRCVAYDLETLGLRENYLGGTLPDRLGDFASMIDLDLYGNNVDGHIPVSIGSLKHLENLDFSWNNFTSSLPESMGNLRNLHIIGNKIYGQVPTSIGNLSYLERLDLSQNCLNGSIPEGLGQCKAIVIIDISSNFLDGIVSESHLANLSRLHSLDLSFNFLDLNFSSNWSPPFQLTELHMRSCRIKSKVPKWLQTQTVNLEVLDLSDNMMSGELLDCFPSMQLYIVNVSHNQFTGLVPYFSSIALSTIDLSYNAISGPLLPPSARKAGYTFCNMSSLVILYLESNQLFGSVSDCLCKSRNLAFIKLSHNGFSGTIPASLGVLQQLTVLKLNNNALEGHIPWTLKNCTSLRLLDLSVNKLFGKMAMSYPSPLMILKLRSNRFEGIIPRQFCTLTYLQILDLADNNIVGKIPRCLGRISGMGIPNPALLAPPYMLAEINDETATWHEDLVVVLKGEELEYSTTLGLVVSLDLSCNELIGRIPRELTNLSSLIGLNLSHNRLTGSIPENIGNMGPLESLDLSNNNLSGTIPQSLSALTLMVLMNLSYNKLHGEIPTGPQLQVIEDPSMAYIGNPGLRGDPLPNKCGPNPDNNQPTQVQVLHEGPDKEDKREHLLFCFVVFWGFAAGFWGAVGSLLLKRRLRFALFQLVGNVANYFYVRVMIRLNRLRN